MNKLYSATCGFCVCTGGLALMLSENVSITTVLAAVGASALFILCGPLIRYETPQIAKIHALISSAVSAYTAVLCVTDSGALDKSFVPLLILLVTALCVYAVYTENTALQRLCVVTVLISAAVIAIIIISCLVNSGFSAITFGAFNTRMFFCIVAFSGADAMLFKNLSVKNSRFAYLGAASAIVCAAAFSVIAAAALGNAAAADPASPWLMLWRSAYIASFVNSCEIIAVCAFFIICVIKACLFLKIAASGKIKKRAVAVTGTFLIIWLLLYFYKDLLAAAAAAVIILAIASPLCGLIRKNGH